MIENFKQHVNDEFAKFLSEHPKLAESGIDMTLIRAIWFNGFDSGNTFGRKTTIEIFNHELGIKAKV